MNHVALLLPNPLEPTQKDGGAQEFPPLNHLTPSGLGASATSQTAHLGVEIDVLKKLTRVSETRIVAGLFTF